VVSPEFLQIEFFKNEFSQNPDIGSKTIAGAPRRSGRSWHSPAPPAYAKIGHDPENVAAGGAATQLSPACRSV
jgi:hypothetical protein